MLITLAGLSAIFALIVLFSVSKDIVWTIWAKIRNKEYQWETPRFFQEDKTWGWSLFYGAVWFIGLYILCSELLRLHP